VAGGNIFTLMLYDPREGVVRKQMGILYNSTCRCLRCCAGPRGGGRSGRARSLCRRFRLRDVLLPPVRERHFRSLRVGDLRHRGARRNVLRDVKLRVDPLEVFEGLVRVRCQGLGRLIRVLSEQYRNRAVDDVPVEQCGLYGPFLETDGCRRVPKRRERQVLGLASSYTWYP
jgi:hypothetical protein